MAIPPFNTFRNKEIDFYKKLNILAIWFSNTCAKPAAARPWPGLHGFD
jgi:hypothetical protein